MESGSNPGTTRSLTRLVPVAGVMMLLLTGCGGDGITLPTPTRTDLPSISVSLPTRSPSVEVTPTPTEAPSESEIPSEAPSVAPTPEPTQEPTQEPSETPTPTPTRTARPTESVVVTETVTPTTSVTETETATPTRPERDPEPDAHPVRVHRPGAGRRGRRAADLALVGARRTGGSSRGLAGRASAEPQRVGRRARHGRERRRLVRPELLPQLQQAPTLDAVVGGWQVSAARVSTVEDRLTGLEAAAPNEARGTRARTLRDAVRASRADVELILSSRDEVSAPVQLAASSARLLAALNPAPPPG